MAHLVMIAKVTTSRKPPIAHSVVLAVFCITTSTDLIDLGVKRSLV